MPAPSRIRQVGMLLFPRMTQLDLTAPYEVFTRMPATAVHLVAAKPGPVVTDRRLVLNSTTTLAQCPALDVIMVPGGPGQQDLMEDTVVLDFLRRQADQAEWVTSVCTGALVLGAAGLLRGYRATTHWTAVPLLPLLGAVPVDARVVLDRNRVTGGGVTAGIDFGLRLAALMHGEEVAQRIQLQIEYNPQPPFASGSPATAPATVADAVRAGSAELQAQRLASCQAIARHWASQPRSVLSA